MSGLAEACCCDSLQRHTLECPGANIAHKLVVVVSVKLSANSDPEQNAVTHHSPACCSSAVVTLHERRNRDAVVVANAWIACTLVLAYDAEELPCSVQKDSCTCLLWNACQTHVAQQVPVAMLSDLASCTRCLSFDSTPNGHTTQGV